MHLSSNQSQQVAFCVARQPWHHALIMRWRTGNTVHCLLKEYYSYPQRENTKNRKKYEMVSEALGQRADVHPCTFEREVIWAPSRFAFEREFYTMTCSPPKSISCPLWYEQKESKENKKYYLRQSKYKMGIGHYLWTMLTHSPENNRKEWIHWTNR